MTVAMVIATVNFFLNILVTALKREIKERCGESTKTFKNRETKTGLGRPRLEDANVTYCIHKARAIQSKITLNPELMLTADILLTNGVKLHSTYFITH